MEQLLHTPVRVRRSQEQIKQLLSEFEDGDNNVSKFCGLHKISNTTFYKWQSRYKKEKVKNSRPVGGFSKLKVHAPYPDLSPGLFAEVRGIKIYQPVAASYLKELAVS
jgi:hypothetical protein